MGLLGWKVLFKQKKSFYGLLEKQKNVAWYITIPKAIIFLHPSCQGPNSFI